MTLEREMIIEQPRTTKKTNLDNLTKAKIYRKELEWWDESIPSSPYLPMIQFPSPLKSPIPFNEKGGQIDEMMEVIETS